MFFPFLAQRGLDSGNNESQNCEWPKYVKLQTSRGYNLEIWIHLQCFICASTLSIEIVVDNPPNRVFAVWSRKKIKKSQVEDTVLLESNDTRKISWLIIGNGRILSGSLYLLFDWFHLIMLLSLHCFWACSRHKNLINIITKTTIVHIVVLLLLV